MISSHSTTETSLGGATFGAITALLGAFRQGNIRATLGRSSQLRGAIRQILTAISGKTGAARRGRAAPSRIRSRSQPCARKRTVTLREDSQSVACVTVRFRAPGSWRCSHQRAVGAPCPTPLGSYESWSRASSSAIRVAATAGIPDGVARDPASIGSAIPVTYLPASEAR